MGTNRWNWRAAGTLGLLLCLLAGSRGAFAQGIDTSGFAGEVFSLLNQERAANGLPGFHGSGALDNSAQSYSEAMRRATAGGPVFLSHTSPDGSTFEDRINAAGYSGWTAIGENIAAGQKSPQEVVDAWMNSPGHRANILDPNFRDVGIGIAVGPGTWSNGYKDPQVIWWTTDFGNSRQSDSSGGNPNTPLPVTPPPASPPSNPTPPASVPTLQPPSPPPAASPTPQPVSNPVPTPALTAVPPSAGTLSVTAFGARGDGKANDAPAIQAAINAAQPGDSIYFPSGTYRLDASVVVGKGSITLRGDGSGSVIQHGNQIGFQLVTGNGRPTGLEVKQLRFVGLPGQYQADGNQGEAIEISGPNGTIIRDCEFDGSGMAIREAGDPGTTRGTRILNCVVKGWGSSAMVLVGGDLVENCSLVQDDPDGMAARSAGGLLLRSGCTDVLVMDTRIANARTAAVQVGGDGIQAPSRGIQLRRLTVNGCRGGIAIGGGAAAPAPIKDLLIEGCSILGTYGDAALSVRQGDGVQIRNNVLDGGPAGLALGLWGPAEPNRSVASLQAAGNAIRNCQRGIWALASNGGSFANVMLSGNSITSCQIALDLSGAPGITVQPSLRSTPGPAGDPVITGLANGGQDPIATIHPGYHFLIRGLGFGDNAAGTNHVRFIAGGAELEGQTFFWSNDTIGIVAPSYAGPVDVRVEVEVSGARVTSNHVPLLVQ